MAFNLASIAGSSPLALAVGSTDGTVDKISKPGTSSVYGLDKDDFLELFLAQLKNQDPTNPADDKEFLGQLSQLTMIDVLTQVQTALSGSQLAQCSSLIGKHITGLDVDGKPVSGVVELVVQSNDAGLVLMVGEQAVQPNNVFTVTDAAPATGGSGDTGGSTTSSV